MGGAQPLAGRMAGAAILCIDIDPERAEKRKEIGYLEEIAPDLDTALAMIDAAVKEKRATSVGLVGNAAEVYPEIVRRGIVPDIVTDQTSAHDLVYGYVPKGMSLDEVQAAARRGPGPVDGGQPRLDRRSCDGPCWSSRGRARKSSTTAT